MKYEEMDGDLIVLAKEGKFDVIAHGCNCFCVMGAGLAPQMAKAFGADKFELEHKDYRGSIDKLGRIDFRTLVTCNDKVYETILGAKQENPGVEVESLSVVNCYSQYDMTGRRKGEIDLDYDALALCFKKMNHIFKGKHIGLPEIGCHLAGGDWNIVKKMIQEHFTDCDVTVVHYKPC